MPTLKNLRETECLFCFGLLQNSAKRHLTIMRVIRAFIKQNISVEIDNGEDTIEAMFYVMDDKYCQKMQTPTEYYYGGIERGYKSNGMPVEELKTAFERCMAEVN